MGLVNRQRLLFIGGIGRSGSTLIEKLLNEFDDAAAIGETVHLWERGVRDDELCGCGARFHACPFWTAVGKDAFGGWSEIDLDQAVDLRWSVDRSRQLPGMLAAHRRGSPNRSQQDYLDLIASVIAAAGRVASAQSGATVLIDSSKHLSTAVLYALDPRLDVRVLHLVRDPRGVAYSWTKEIVRPEAEGATAMAEMPTYDPVRTAGRWVTDNLGFAWLARLGIPRLEMRYEDFLDGPVAGLARIAEFAGLSSRQLSGTVLDGATGRLATPMHSVAGNPLRFGGTDITLRLDDDWRAELPAGRRRLVTALTAPARRRFGY